MSVHQVGQRGRGVDVLPVETGDHVALLDTGLLGGAVGHGVLDLGTGRGAGLTLAALTALALAEAAVGVLALTGVGDADPEERRLSDVHSAGRGTGDDLVRDGDRVVDRDREAL